jgi:hypothetical protein
MPSNREPTFKCAIPAGLAGAAMAAGALAAAQPTVSPPAGPDAGGHDATAGPKFSNPTRITNPWLPLSTTGRVELRGVKDGKAARSVRTLLKRIKTFRFAGRSVRAAIVEDRAYEAGRLHEIALDYYAQADDGTVYYVGEDVKIYDRTGKHVVSHEGAFLYGRDTDTLGIAMPAHPRAGRRFIFERVPGQGSERNRVAGTKASLTVPAGVFQRALKVRAYVLPEKEREIKWYARGVGLLKEKGSSGSVELVRRPSA